jgi:Icc-related predicted phosphoesterase
MLLVADVHGAFDALGEVASRGEPLVVLGDLLNFVDYRTHDGLLADIAGHDLVAEMVAARTGGDMARAAAIWQGFVAGREDEVRRAFGRAIRESYREMAAALEGADAYVTFGNSDRPDLLREALPAGVRFVHGETVEIEGLRVGIVGGGAPALGVPGEVGDSEMRARLDGLGPIDLLATHVTPGEGPLARDVIGGPVKSSPAVLEFVRRVEPGFHYFGDVHQPRATTWRIGRTLCRNVGYFRATGRAVRHG